MLGVRGQHHRADVAGSGKRPLLQAAGIMKSLSDAVAESASCGPPSRRWPSRFSPGLRHRAFLGGSDARVSAAAARAGGGGGASWRICWTRWWKSLARLASQRTKAVLYVFALILLPLAGIWCWVLPELCAPEHAVDERDVPELCRTAQTKGIWITKTIQKSQQRSGYVQQYPGGAELAATIGAERCRTGSGNF